LVVIETHTEQFADKPTHG